MARQVCEDKSRETASSSTGLIFYTDMSSSNPTIQTHIQAGFVSEPPADMFNTVMWKSFLGSKPGSQHAAGPSSSSKTMNDDSSTNFYHQNIEQDFTPGVSVSETTSSENLILHDSSSAPWQDQNKLLDGGDVDDSSLRCVFPCDHVHERRPSQGLSLSLSSTNNPSNIGLQSFELRHTTDHHHHQQQMLQDGYLMNTKAAANINYQGQIQFLLKNSKFLLPLQDLLNEFCSLGIKQNDLPKQKSQKNKNWEEDNGMKYSLSSLEFVELQKRKTKLLSMLEEVERRYRHYCNQMKAVVSTFEAVAGNGAAIVYSALALKTMSRHFRCLKEGILDQIQATRKAMGEKDPVTPGATRGETPRLRILDRALRQQRAFQQINMMETHPWRPQRGLPERSVSILRAWLFEHFLHPYPSDVDKHILARQTGLSRSQVSNWFINARVRLWKPMVEEMYMEEEKEQQRNAISSEGGANNEEDITMCTTDVQNPISPTRNEDQKPAQVARLLRIDSECVSSIINNTDHKNDPKSLNPLGSGRATDTFGSVDLDFSSYTHHSSDMVNVPYTSNDHGANQSFHGGGGVSLTLGLQQHGGSGVSLAFPAATVQSPMFFTRDQIEECQTVQYSLLDSEGQNMPYRNLMGTQLLHDLA